jgi:hypothetical protein
LSQANIQQIVAYESKVVQQEENIFFNRPCFSGTGAFASHGKFPVDKMVVSFRMNFVCVDSPHFSCVDYKAPWDG